MKPVVPNTTLYKAGHGIFGSRLRLRRRNDTVDNLVDLSLDNILQPDGSSDLRDTK
jgi:hypothetical protein